VQEQSGGFEKNLAYMSREQKLFHLDFGISHRCLSEPSSKFTLETWDVNR
jgi:hypothetical protein